jgi:hypothetical protein
MEWWRERLAAKKMGLLLEDLFNKIWDCNRIYDLDERK